MTTRARGVAGSLGTKVTPAVADQVESTLTAAMVDEGAARAVRSGLLVAAIFGLAPATLTRTLGDQLAALEKALARSEPATGTDPTSAG